MIRSWQGFVGKRFVPYAAQVSHDTLAFRVTRQVLISDGGAIRAQQTDGVDAVDDAAGEELAQDEAPPFFTSAATTEGVPQLMAKVCELLDSVATPQPAEALTVFRPQPKKERVVVSIEGDIFVVSSPRAEKLLARMDLENPEARTYIRQQFARMGVASALKKAGVKPGDTVRFGKVEMKWD